MTEFSSIGIIDDIRKQSGPREWFAVAPFGSLEPVVFTRDPEDAYWNTLLSEAEWDGSYARMFSVNLIITDPPEGINLDD